MIAGDIAKGVVEGVGSVLDDLFTSDEERGKIAIALEKIKNAPFLASLKVLEKEASHASVFVAGARPALLWACVLSIVYEGFFRGFLVWILLLVDPTLPPVPSIKEVMWEIVSLAGMLYGVRGVEKIKGVARNNMPNPPAENS